MPYTQLFTSPAMIGGLANVRLGQMESVELPKMLLKENACNCGTNYINM
jgi:hypothetical protein